MHVLYFISLLVINTYWVSFDPQKPSPKWPIMCLVGR